jgi:hypothetical protein
MKTIDILKLAITTKSPALIVYKDKLRDILPFMLGKTRDDRIVLQAWQRGEGGGWRFFYLNEMLEGSVASPPAYFDPSIWDEPMATIKKSEDGYKPPAFVTEVIAQVLP